MSERESISHAEFSRFVQEAAEQRSRADADSLDAILSTEPGVRGAEILAENAAMRRVMEQAADWVELPIQAYSRKWDVDWQYGSDPVPHITALREALTGDGGRRES